MPESGLSNVAKMWQTRHETDNQPPIDRPNERAPNAAPRKSAPREGRPGVSFICKKGGRGVAGPHPHTNIHEISGWRTRPNFLAKFFWEKILEIKIVLL